MYLIQTKTEKFILSCLIFENTKQKHWQKKPELFYVWDKLKFNKSVDHAN